MKNIKAKRIKNISGFTLFVICSLLIHTGIMFFAGNSIQIRIPVILNYKVNLVKTPDQQPPEATQDKRANKAEGNQDSLSVRPSSQGDITISDTRNLTKIDKGAPTYTRYGYDLRLFENKKKYIPREIWDKKGPPDLEAEETCLENALQKDANNTEIKYLLGQNLYQQEKYTESRKIIDGVLKKEPANEMALETQAHISFAMQRNMETLRLAEEGLKRYPQNEQLLYLQAAGYLYGEEDIDKCFQIIEKAKQINPNDPTLYNLEAEAVFAMGGPENEVKGFRMYEENIKRFPDHFVNYIYLADRLYSQKGEYKRALELASKAKSIKPSDARPYMIIGDIYQEKGQIKEAIEEYLSGLKMKPKFKYQGEIRVRLAKAYKQNKQYKLAEKFYREAVACEERVPEPTVEKAETYFYYANFLIETGKLEEAMKYINKGREIDDKEKTGYISLCYWHKAKQNIKEAEKYYNMVINDGDDTNAFNSDVQELKRKFNKKS